jgi:hypothetical protein
MGSAWMIEFSVAQSVLERIVIVFVEPGVGRATSEVANPEWQAIPARRESGLPPLIPLRAVVSWCCECIPGSWRRGDEVVGCEARRGDLSAPGEIGRPTRSGDTRIGTVD